MAADEIHVGDVGTELRATIYDGSTTVDISGANTTTARLFYLKNSAGTVSTLTASFLSGSGTAGGLVFTSTSSTFDTSGSYELQARVTISGKTFSSDIYKFTVFPNLV